ncbi:hypothetical protein NKI57_29155 [Mesorhizobium sp. M0579]
MISTGKDEHNPKKVEGNEALVLSTAKETGITEDQARDLVRLIGTGRNSLLREARQLLRQRLASLDRRCSEHGYPVAFCCPAVIALRARTTSAGPAGFITLTPDENASGVSSSPRPE